MKEKELDLSQAVMIVDKFLSLKIPPRKTYLSPWLTEDSITLVYGWRGSGKTWFAMAIADAITMGTQLGPWECKESVPCLYLDAEMTTFDTKSRLTSMAHKNRKSELLIYSSAYAAKKGILRADLNNPEWRQSFKALLLHRGIRLWIGDNISSLCPSKPENTKEDWDPVNQWLLDLRFHGIATILIHHEGKDGSQRGTSGREDNIDNSISLKRPRNHKTESGADFTVMFLKNRVETDDLHLLAPVRCSMGTNGNGKFVCKWEDHGTAKKEAILTMVHKGIPVSEISRKLNVTTRYVYQVKQDNTKVAKKS